MKLGRDPIPETGGLNQSAPHWDILKDMKKDGEIYADGKFFHKNGRFLELGDQVLCAVLCPKVPVEDRSIIMGSIGKGICFPRDALEGSGFRCFEEFLSELSHIHEAGLLQEASPLRERVHIPLFAHAE